MLQKQLWESASRPTCSSSEPALSVGAALRAAELKGRRAHGGAGRLESSGCLGGGNDHFTAALGTDEPNDTREAFVRLLHEVRFRLPRSQLNQWFDAIKPCVKILEEVDTEFLIKDGKRYRSVGFGQPGAWWLHITNGTTIKRHLARRVRKSGVNILDDFHITRLFEARRAHHGVHGLQRPDPRSVRHRMQNRHLFPRLAPPAPDQQLHRQPLQLLAYAVQHQQLFRPAHTDQVASLVSIDISGRATLIPKGWGARPA